MTEIAQKVSPETYFDVDPEYGFWSIKKEIALMYLTYPFQQIADKWFDSFYYIDLFAGSGLMKASEHQFFVGSPIVAVGSTLKDKKFSKYICLECDAKRRDVLNRRLEKVCNHYETSQPIVIPADCNQEIDRVLKEHSPHGSSCFLAFVDPQKYTDLKWSTLEKLLLHGKGDLILNFPTMSVTRNLKIDECIPSLSAFLGGEEWVYCTDRTMDSVLENYKENIRRYRRNVDSLQVLGETHNRLFDLVFATNSMGMKNALSDLKEKLDEIRTKDIDSIHSVIAKGQKQMGDWV